jgi:hypothetical protein
MRAQLELKEGENASLKRKIESFGERVELYGGDGAGIPYHQRAKNFIFGMLQTPNEETESPPLRKPLSPKMDHLSIYD